MHSAFISSTSRDLAEYRDAAIDVCNSRQIVPIAMEFFEAMGAGATAGSKRALEQADLYVGIVAHRYGYIEDGYDASVTESEFDYAGARGLERLCFLVRPDYPWPPDAIDYEHHDRLNAFKQRLEKAVIRHEFSTLDDFRAKLLLSITKWQERRGIHAGSARLFASNVIGVPPRPSLFVGRESDVRAIKQRLQLHSGGSALVIVRGWPGVGKTTIVNSVAHDSEVSSEFSGGVFWASLGPAANRVSQLVLWKRGLGGDQSARDPSEAELIADVRELLRDRRALLIVDDAWHASDAVPFKHVGGPRCAVVVSTRFSDVARELASVVSDDIYVLDVLSEDAGVQLLRRVAPRVVSENSEGTRQLVNDLEGLPLALRVAGRLLEADYQLGVPIRPLLEELGHSHKLLSGIAPDDRFDAATGTTPTIGLLLQRSTDRLSEEDRMRFGTLGVFAAKPATFDIDAMAFVWQTDDPFPTVRRLVDRGLWSPS
jgi:hypothetical protein